jgi:uncharacterized membrane protein YidH (DUF202 family)
MTDPENNTPERRDEPDSGGKPNLLQVAWSVIAALFGVQSAKNRERDFRKGDARDYIAIYVILVIGLVVGMVVAVNMVLDAAGK